MHYCAVIFHEIRRMPYSVQFMTLNVVYYRYFNLDTAYRKTKNIVDYCRYTLNPEMHIAWLDSEIQNIILE